VSQFPGPSAGAPGLTPLESHVREVAPKTGPDKTAIIAYSDRTNRFRQPPGANLQMPIPSFLPAQFSQTGAQNPPSTRPIAPPGNAPRSCPQVHFPSAPKKYHRFWRMRIQIHIFLQTPNTIFSRQSRQFSLTCLHPTKNRTIFPNTLLNPPISADNSFHHLLYFVI